MNVIVMKNKGRNGTENEPNSTAFRMPGVEAGYSELQLGQYRTKVGRDFFLTEANEGKSEAGGWKNLWKPFTIMGSQGRSRWIKVGQGQKVFFWRTSDIPHPIQRWRRYVREFRLPGRKQICGGLPRRSYEGGFLLDLERGRHEHQGA
jgi:hypothetical protein